MRVTCENSDCSEAFIVADDAEVGTCPACGLPNDLRPREPGQNDRADDQDQSGGSSPKVSQSTLLVELALELFDLGVTDSGDVFGVDRCGANVALQLRGGRTSLRAKLAAAFFAECGKAPTASALADAVAVIEGTAANSDPVDVPLRVGRDGDRIVLDLGGPDGRAVVVRPGAWEVVDRSPVLFRRTNLTVPLPTPVRRDGRDDGDGPVVPFLRDLNARVDQLRLLVGWLVSVLLPEIPHPVLALFGVQGTGKSTAGRMIGSVIDASAAPLRSAPRHEDQWVVAAAGSWVVVLDNLSAVQPWLSDALCRAVTGDGAVKRQLYTDSDVAVLKFRRCVVMTSIDAGVLRGDLAERMLPIELDRIDPTSRRTEADILERFATNHGELLGALLDLLAEVLTVLPAIELDELPRMADFARVLAAVDKVTGWNTLAPYLGVGTELAEDVIDADPVAQAVVALVESEGKWSGTASDLLKKITNLDARLPKDWPTQPNALSGRLKRAATALRATGIVVEQGDGRDRRTWHLSSTSDVGRAPSSPSSRPSRSSPHNGSRRDDPRQGTVTRDDPHSTIVTAEPVRTQGGDGGDGGDGQSHHVSVGDLDAEWRSLIAGESGAQAEADE